MILESKQFTVTVSYSEVEFMLHNKESHQTTMILRQHVLLLQNPSPLPWLADEDSTINCDAIQCGPRENLVIIPPPQGPQGPVLVPGGFAPRRR